MLFITKSEQKRGQFYQYSDINNADQIIFTQKYYTPPNRFVNISTRPVLKHTIKLCILNCVAFAKNLTVPYLASSVRSLLMNSLRL